MTASGRLCTISPPNIVAESDSGEIFDEDPDNDCQFEFANESFNGAGTLACEVNSNYFNPLSITTIDPSDSFVGRVESNLNNQHFLNGDFDFNFSMDFDSISDFTNFE